MGIATGLAMAEKGATVILTGRDETRGAGAAEEIRAGGHDAQFIAADFSEFSEVGRVAEEAGEVDVLVNLAGVAAMGATADIDEAAFDSRFHLNVKVPFFLVAALAPRIAARGGGSIISVSTMVARYGQPGLGAYYSFSLSFWTKMGLREKGRLTGSLPWGYRKGEDGIAEPDPEKAPFVRGLFERYASGLHTDRSLAEWLNANDQRTTRGRSFGSDTVREMLCNAAYCGYV